MAGGVVHSAADQHTEVEDLVACSTKVEVTWLTPLGHT